MSFGSTLGTITVRVNADPANNDEVEITITAYSGSESSEESSALPSPVPAPSPPTTAPSAGSDSSS